MELTLCSLTSTVMSTRLFRVYNCPGESSVQTQSLRRKQVSTKSNSSEMHLDPPIIFHVTHMTATQSWIHQVRHGTKKFFRMLSRIWTCLAFLPKTAEKVPKIKQQTSLHLTALLKLPTQCCTVLGRAQRRETCHFQVWINRSSLLTKNSNKSDSSLRQRNKHPPALTTRTAHLSKPHTIPFSAWPTLMATRTEIRASAAIKTLRAKNST